MAATPEKVKTTNRLLALARAIERLSGRDMNVVVKTVYPSDGCDSSRYQLMIKLLRIASEHAGEEG